MINLELLQIRHRLIHKGSTSPDKMIMNHIPSSQCRLYYPILSYPIPQLDPSYLILRNPTYPLTLLSAPTFHSFIHPCVTQQISAATYILYFTQRPTTSLIPSRPSRIGINRKEEMRKTEYDIQLPRKKKRSSKTFEPKRARWTTCALDILDGILHSFIRESIHPFIQPCNQNTTLLHPTPCRLFIHSFIQDQSPSFLSENKIHLFLSHR